MASSITHNLLFVLAISTYLTCTPTFSQHIISNNTTKLPQFIIFDRRTVALPNYHRNRVSLKFTLNGPSLLRVSPKATNSWNLHLDDGSILQFSKTEHSGPFTATEYTFKWNSGATSLGAHEVCFHYGHNNASWYNSYQSPAAHWPMDTSKRISHRHFNYLLDFDYDSQRDESLLILEHLFLNSDGFALMLDSSSPLFISRNPNFGDPLLCFSANNSYPYPSSNSDQEYRNIQLRIFAGKNIKSIYGIVANGLGYIPRPSDIPDEQLFRAPIWTTWSELGDNLNQENVLQFAENVSNYGFPPSTIELHRKWEQHYGDLSFDLKTFPDPKKLIKKIKSLSHQVSLWVYPNIHTDSTEYFKSAKYFIVSGNSTQPFQVDYSDGTGSYVDFSNPEAVDWFVERLEHFKTKFGIDGFHFNEAVLYDFTSLKLDFKFQNNPSLLTNQYADCAGKLGNKAIILDSAFKNQNLPNFVDMNAKNSDWSSENGLKSLIPTVLALSIAGYSFVVPGIIGGGFSIADPSEELYIRWVQATALLPAMKFSTPPWRYSPEVVNLTKHYVALHAQFAPTFIDLAKRRVRDGTPVIRAMWYIEPNDPRTYLINDQFMIGDDLLVAPILEKGARKRKVYLPTGKWINQRGTTQNGPAEVVVKAGIDELPYFRRFAS